MKILSIRLKNLASLSDEHFIDFESEPLASAGLIAIVGKTGAGKSTILDAMCLALFNKIPRLKESDGKLTDVDGSELLTNSPLTVLRRGCAHGFAELCFVAQDQKHYLARWEIKRARENATGKLQNVQRSLKCLTDGVVVADKSKAVESHIQHITQLSFEQFTRAVLLAQSEVTAFLKARDTERGELLEYLTNSAIFAKIGQLAFEKTREISNRRKSLESHLGYIEIRSDEEVAELQAQFESVQQQVVRLEEAKTQFRQQQQWFEQRDKLDQDIRLKQQHYDVQLKAQESLEKNRLLLSQLETFSVIRPIVFQQQQIQKTLQQLIPQIQLQHTEFNTLSTQFEQEKTRYSQVEQSLHQFQAFEQKYQKELADLRGHLQKREHIKEDYNKTRHRLTQITSQQQPLLEQQQQLEQTIHTLDGQHTASMEQLKNSAQYAPLDQGLNAHMQQLSQFITQYQKVEQSLGSIRDAQTQLEHDEAELNALISQFGTPAQIDLHIESKQQRKQAQQIHSNHLHSTQQKIQRYFELNNEMTSLKHKFETIKQHNQQLDASTHTSEQAYVLAKQEREKIQQILQQQRLLHAENIEHLRAALKHGEACVVCGSTEHPYREDQSQLSKALYELQQQQEQQAIEQEQQCFDLWQKTQQQYTQSQTQLKQLQDDLQQLHEKQNVHEQQLQQHLLACNIQLDLRLAEQEANAQLDALMQKASQEQQQLEHELHQLQQASKQQHQLSQRIQHTRHQLETVDQLQQHVQHIVACLTTEDKSAWYTHGVTFSQTILNALQQRSQLLEQTERLVKHKEQQHQQLLLLKSNLAGLNAQHTECTQQLKDIETMGKQNTEAANQLIVTMTASTDLKANEWLLQHDQQRQQLQQQYQQIKQSFELARERFEQHKNALEQLKAKQQQQHDSLTQCNTEINAWLAQQPLFEEDQLLALLAISSSQEQQIRQAIQHADRGLSEAISALNTLQHQLDVHLEAAPQIEAAQLSEQIATNQVALQQCTDQRDDLKIKLELHQQNLIKQQQFAAQIQLIQQQEHRWHKISSLIGDAKGKEFRDLAQQYNLDILLEYANQQLTQLSQRYTLKRLENSLSLAIVDHDMDGEIRAVASLSGGESFLTALAISLAIANMASGSMKIESLFIDEGFGTLDASSLHMVMNALDQLQSQGRKVVLISHIQDMHERIPVQIQVQPLGSGSSRIQVVG
ncbi:AAA family ATPase [Acinetobacter soli]|uniref:AAA family ATPase n=1 Tax=Acinetobacter soli TaxID=487316 RepID=UPI0032B5A6AF